MAKAAGRIRIGVGGWTFAPWRGPFYPPGLAQKRELDYASRHLTSIEINGTYYGSQKPESFAKWRAETPDDFVFALKAPRFATNRKALAEAGASVERFFASGVLELKEKLGPINWQFLPTKRFEAADFERFLALLPASIDGRRLRHAVEVRHESFRTPEFVALARARGVAVVVAADGPHPTIAEATADFVYARIMGTREAEPLGYDAAALDRWAGRARAWAAGRAAEGLAGAEGTESAAGAKGAAGTKGAAGAESAAARPRRRDVFLYVIGGHKVLNPAAAMALIARTR